MSDTPNTDEARLDWIEQRCHALTWDDMRPGVVKADDGTEHFGDTLRDAIDAAMRADYGDPSENSELFQPPVG